MIKFIALAVCALLLVPSAASAAARVELANSVALLESHNGVLVAVPMKGPATPGERLRYTIVAKNTGDRAAAKLAPVAKIPAGERYIGNTAGAAAEFSVDAGKTWSPRPTVTLTNPGGGVTQRPALPAEFNAIRWLGPELLAPGARMTFAYDVTVE